MSKELQNIDLSMWGFKHEPINEFSSYFTSTDSHSKNHIILYQIMPGIRIFDIHFTEPFHHKDTPSFKEPDFKIAFNEEGYYTSNIRNSNPFISPNEVFVGRNHTNIFNSHSIGDRLRCFNIQINPRDFKNAVDKMSVKSDHLGLVDLYYKLMPKLIQNRFAGFTMTNSQSIQIAKDLICALNNRDFWLIRLKVMELLYNVTRDHEDLKNESKLKTNEVNDKIRLIERHIRENYKEPLKLYEYYKRFDITKNTLNFYFKLIFKYSPHEYLNIIRMRKAQDLLKYTNHSISKISNMVGFENQSNFARSFKKYTEIGPREFRLKHKNYFTKQKSIIKK